MHGLLPNVAVCSRIYAGQQASLIGQHRRNAVRRLEIMGERGSCQSLREYFACRESHRLQWSPRSSGLRRAKQRVTRRMS